LTLSQRQIRPLEDVILTEDKKKTVVWIIDSEQWPRATIRAELMERGFDVIGFATTKHAVAAYKHQLYAKPQIIILELFGLDADEDDISSLGRIGVPIIVLGGAVELNREIVKNSEWAATIQRPFTIGKVSDMVEELVE